MTWVGFALLTWVLLGLELGLRRMLEIGSTGIAPSFVFPLIALVALAGTPGMVHRTALILGLLMDLLSPVALAEGRGEVVVLGPWALGFLVAAHFMLNSRGLIVRRNPLSLGIMAMAGHAIAGIVALFFLLIRKWILGDVSIGAGTQLLAAMGSAVYTGLVAPLLGLVMIPLASTIGLQSLQQRRFARTR
jgi:hypothetical protein